MNIPYLDLFKKYAEIYNVPLPLSLAIAKVESNFNPNAKRYEKHLKTTSYGLFQILETTAIQLGWKKPKIPQFKHPLLNPELNIKYGTLHLSNLLKKYNNIEDVIASYNMGYPRKASETTPHIKKIFGEPKIYWKYANQPYVDNVLKWYNYFAKELNKNFNLITLFLPFVLFYIFVKYFERFK